MKDSSFKVVVSAYKLINLIDVSTVNVPNREKMYLDRLEATMYDLVSNIFTANNLDTNIFKKERLYLESTSLANLNILGFLINRAYKKGYITEKNVRAIAHQIESMEKLIKGWINFEENDNQRA